MCKRIKREIPNALTCCNLLSGCLAVTFASGGDYGRAALFIFIGGVFDFLDGMTARLLHVSSPIGRELDSLSDVVTFGLAPAMMIHTFLSQPSPLTANLSPLTANLILYIPFLMTVFSALRLARFNLDERQATSFIGLPTSANGLFWASLLYNPSTLTSNLSPLTIYIVLILLVLLFSWLLVSPIPIFSMKFHNLSWRDNRVRYVFLAVSVVLLAVLGIHGGAAAIGWYIILSLFTKS